MNDFPPKPYGQCRRPGRIRGTVCGGMIMERYLPLCSCGGMFRDHWDSITAECGGEVVTQRWAETYCDRCGLSPAEAMPAPLTDWRCQRCGTVWTSRPDEWDIKLLEVKRGESA